MGYISAGRFDLVPKPARPEFRVQVKAACIAELRASHAARTKEGRIFVEPFGTESHGVALIEVASPQKSGAVTYLCLMDKRSTKVTAFVELQGFAEPRSWQSLRHPENPRGHD